MAKETSQSEILAKMKTRGFGKELSAGKDTPPLTGNARLPAGIEAGIAQVHTVKIGEYTQGEHQGQLFFYAAATMKEPKVHGGITVAGIRTQIGPEPLCDTPKGSTFKTKQDHVNRMIGWLYGLGIKQGTLTSEEALLNACKVLEQQKPHIRIRTWKGSKQEIRQVGGKWCLCRISEDGTATPVPGKTYQTEKMAKDMNRFAGQDPRVNEEWCGVCPPPASQLTPEQVAVNGFKSPPQGPTPVGEPKAGADAELTADNEFDQAGQAEPEADTAAPEGVEGSEAADSGTVESFVTSVIAELDTLVEEANKEAESSSSETPAQDKLRQAALALGKTTQEVDDAPDWQALADMISPPAESDEAKAEAAEEPAACPWKKDDVCFALQLDPKTDKPLMDGKTKKQKKAIPHLIVSVDEANSVLTLKDVATQKMVMKGKSARKFTFDEVKAEQF